MKGITRFTLTLTAEIVTTRNGMKNRIIVGLGFSLSLLIGTFTLWGGLRLTTMTGLDIPDILKYWSVPLLFAVGLGLFSVLLRKSLPSKSFLTSLAVFSSIFILGGYTLLIALGPFEGIGILFVSVSAVSIGFGYSAMMLLWQHHFAQFSEDIITKTLLLSLALSALEYLVLLFLFQDHIGFAFPFLVLASVVLGAISNYAPPIRVEEISLLQNEPGAIKKILLELRDSLFCVGAIAFAVALTRAIALDGIDNPDMANITASFSIIFVSLVLYLIWFGFGKNYPLFGKLNILGLYRIFFPVIATALLALSIGGSSWGLAVTTLVYAVFSIVSTFIVSTSISIARNHKIWSPHVYGIFAGCLYVVFTLATTIAPLIYYPQNFGAATFTVIVLVVFYILAMSYVAIQNRKKRSASGSDSSDGDESSPNSDSPDEQAPQKTSVIDEVAQGCTILADQNRLTRRERDILLLIARGRDVPSVAKQLFISENTVRSHSKSVYRKLDIHSKQELLDLLETIYLERSFNENQ